MVRFLHTSDWQLGMTRHFLEGEAQARFSQDRFDAVVRIGKAAEEAGAAFIVVAGDTFEDNRLDRRIVVRAMDALSKVSVPVYIVPGNHEPLDGGSIYHSKAFQEHCPPHVHVVEDSEPIEVAPGVDLVGAPWFSKRPLQDLIAKALDDLEADGRRRIVVGHGAVDVLSPDRDDPAVIGLSNLEEKLRADIIHYVGLGDRHSRTPVGDSGRVWYSGAHVATGYRDFAQTEPNHVLVVDLDEVDCQVKPVSVGNWFFDRRMFNMSHADDVAAFESFIEQIADKQRTVLKAGFEGALGIQDTARLDALEQHARDILGGYERWDRQTNLVLRPTSEDLDSMALTGFAREGFDRIQQMASQDGEEAELAQEALALVYRLSKEVST